MKTLIYLQAIVSLRRIEKFLNGEELDADVFNETCKSKTILPSLLLSIETMMYGNKPQMSMHLILCSYPGINCV